MRALIVTALGLLLAIPPLAAQRPTPADVYYNLVVSYDLPRCKNRFVLRQQAEEEAEEAAELPADSP